MKIKKRKRNKIIVFFIIAIVIAILVTVGLDYNKYNNFKESILFGSKDVYSQDQPLYFEDLKITITRVKNTAYDYQTYYGCYKIAEQAGTLLKSNNFVETPEWHALSNKSSNCIDQANSYQNKKIFIVNYSIKNTSNKPLDISTYKMKIYGDEETESVRPKNKITTLFAGQSRNNSFDIYGLDKKKDGPFAFIVSQHGKQKQILLKLPKLTPFCTNEQCDKQVYDRTL